MRDSRNMSLSRTPYSTTWGLYMCVYIYIYIYIDIDIDYINMIMSIY